MHTGAPILFYWWEPDAMILKSQMEQFGSEWALERVSLPTHTSQCEAVRPTTEEQCAGVNDTEGAGCDYAVSMLYKIFPAVLSEYHPLATSFLLSFTITNDDQQQMLLKSSYTNATLRQTACEWVQQNEEVWRAWIPRAATTATCSTHGSDSTRGAQACGGVDLGECVPIEAPYPEGICLCADGSYGDTCKASPDHLVLIATVVSTTVFALLAIVLFIAELRRERKARQLYFNKDGNLIQCKLPPGLKFHLFLSHHWKSAQDQTHLIKRELASLVPSLNIFLDVDDLADTAPETLEQGINQSAVVLIFMSRGYFKSNACSVEYHAAAAARKPIILVHEADPYHGGMPLEDLYLTCPEELRGQIFTKLTPIIPWVRAPAFQLLNFKHIVSFVLHHVQVLRQHSGSTRAASEAGAGPPRRMLSWRLSPSFRHSRRSQESTGFAQGNDLGDFSYGLGEASLSGRRKTRGTVGGCMSFEAAAKLNKRKQGAFSQLKAKQGLIGALAAGKKFEAFTVGTRVTHPKRGVGTVMEMMSDGRVRVLFDESGEEHRYKMESMHKIFAVGSAAPTEAPEEAPKEAVIATMEDAVQDARVQAIGEKYQKRRVVRRSSIFEHVEGMDHVVALLHTNMAKRVQRRWRKFRTCKIRQHMAAKTVQRVYRVYHEAQQMLTNQITSALGIGSRAPLIGHIILGHRRDPPLTKLSDLVSLDARKRAVIYKVGLRVEHEVRGTGVIVNIDHEHDKREVHFDNGEVHRYGPMSLHKLKPLGVATNTNKPFYVPESRHTILYYTEENHGVNLILDEMQLYVSGLAKVKIDSGAGEKLWSAASNKLRSTCFFKGLQESSNEQSTPADSQPPPNQSEGEARAGTGAAHSAVATGDGAAGAERLDLQMARSLGCKRLDSDPPRNPGKSRKIRFRVVETGSTTPTTAVELAATAEAAAVATELSEDSSSRTRRASVLPSKKMRRMSPRLALRRSNGLRHSESDPESLTRRWSKVGIMLSGLKRPASDPDLRRKRVVQSKVRNLAQTAHRAEQAALWRIGWLKTRRRSTLSPVDVEESIGPRGRLRRTTSVNSVLEKMKKMKQQQPQGGGGDLYQQAEPIELQGSSRANHVFVLLLNNRTFVDEAARRLARVVASVLKTERLQLMLLHVQESERGGVNFDKFFEVTPPELLSAGVYRQIAMPWYKRSSYRAVCINNIAQALGAKKHRAWLKSTALSAMVRDGVHVRRSRDSSGDEDDREAAGVSRTSNSFSRMSSISLSFGRRSSACSSTSRTLQAQARCRSPTVSAGSAAEVQVEAV